MTKEKLTRKEKSEINKRKWQENILKARALTKAEKEDAISTIRNDKEMEWREKFIEAIKLGLNMVQCATAARVGLDKVYKGFDEDEEFNKSYTHAREIADLNKAEFLEEMQNEAPREIYDAQGNKIYDKTELEWRKAKEATTKWLLAIRNPKKYGNTARGEDRDNGSKTIFNIAASITDETLSKLIDVTPADKTKTIEELI